MALAPLVSDNNSHLQEEGLTREVYTLLAQANLLRIRGCWDESVEHCMAALRLAPESSSAQSLLGDVYENQGRYDDAAQWYRMAIDVNPNSPADRMKLELIQRLRQEPQASDAVHSSIPQPCGMVKFVRNPETALRFGAAAAVLLLFLAVGLAFASTHRHGSYAAFGLPSPAEVKLKPVVVSTDQADTALQVSAVHDPAEQALLDALHSSPDLRAQGIVVVDAESDPRTALIELTFGLTAPASGITRAYVQQMALRLLQSTVTLPAAQSANSYQVRCLVLNDNASVGASLVFIGNIAHSSVPASNNTLTDGHLEALFTMPWWSSSVPN